MLTISCALLLLGVYMYSKVDADIYDKTYTLHLPQNDISLIVSNSNESRMRGLGGMNSLPEDKAMLFIFNEPGEYGIWMKDVIFPIDIFWLNEEKEIIHLEQDISPDTFPKIFYPNEKSVYVLEANAGFAKNNNLMVGKVLNFDTK